MKQIKSALVKKIQTSVETIPGVVDYAPLDFENEKDWIILDEHSDSNLISIKMGIIIGRNIYTKTLVDEIQQMIKYILKKEKKTLSQLDVYVKGVK